MAQPKTCKGRRSHNRSQPQERTGPSKDEVRRQDKPDQETKMIVKRPHWHHLGTVALQEIHWYQKTMELLRWKLKFAHLIQELSQDYHPGNTTTESQLLGSAAGKQIHVGGPVRRCQCLHDQCKAYYHTAKRFAFSSVFMRKAIHQVKD